VESGDVGIAQAMAEANSVFGQLAKSVEAAVSKSPNDPIDILEVSRKAKLEIDESILHHLELPRYVYPLPFVHWCCWFPWRPLWCRWWNDRYPWYRCCPYWWSHCRPWAL
jgi:hypothetical protein